MNYFCKQKRQAYLQLMRMDKPIGTLLLLWPTLWALWIAAKGFPHLSVLLVFVIGVLLMRSAGCVINARTVRYHRGAPQVLKLLFYLPYYQSVLFYWC